jgi:hypothetical protein
MMDLSKDSYGDEKLNSSISSDEEDEASSVDSDNSYIISLAMGTDYKGKKN